MRRAILVLLGGLLASCTNASSGPTQVAQTPEASATSTTLSPTTTTTVRECPTVPIANARLSLVDPAELALALSIATHPKCAEVVVVAAPAEAAVATAATIAVDEHAPLLIAGLDGDRLRDELIRLRPRRVVAVGTDIEHVPEAELTTAAVKADSELAPTTGAAVMLVDNANRSLVPVVAAFAAQIGAQVRNVPSDLRRVDTDTRTAIQSAPSVSLLGGFGAAAEWQLDVVRRGIQLPGGGQLLFPGRRLVALYGSPYAPALGILGEQDAEESVAMARDLAADYEAVDGLRTVPAFDLIATVASAGPGEDDDYSYELSVEELRPWVDAAGAANLYVVLDLQPGRADFLTQAKRYEELLALPHVGLALDPEWRLGPDQVHLRQVGTVSGAEVNTVSEWLAALVREHDLPQKLLMIHQFKLSMISERETIRTPVELAVVIQMDGQGPLGTKYDTFNAMIAAADDAGWRWGWKNFYDEDTPTATPEQTLDVEPQPVFISYQ